MASPVGNRQVPPRAEGIERMTPGRTGTAAGRRGQPLVNSESHKTWAGGKRYRGIWGGALAYGTPSAGVLLTLDVQGPLWGEGFGEGALRVRPGSIRVLGEERLNGQRIYAGNASEVPLFYLPTLTKRTCITGRPVTPGATPIVKLNQ